MGDEEINPIDFLEALKSQVLDPECEDPEMIQYPEQLIEYCQYEVNNKLYFYQIHLLIISNSSHFYVFRF